MTFIEVGASCRTHMAQLDGRIKQFRTSCSDPPFYVPTKADSEFEHLARFFVRHGPREIVAADIAFLAKAIKSVDDPSIRSYGELQRLDNAIVMVVPRSSITRGGQGGGCCLESRIVGDRKSPVGR